MIALSLGLFLLGIVIPGSVAQHSVTQDPTVVTSLGQNARMSCTLGGGLTVSAHRVVFYVQKDGNKPKYILYYFTDSKQGKGEGVSSRFTASASGNIGYLSISNVILDDEGIYSCSTWTGSQWIFGAGTYLSVMTGEVKMPIVSIFPPSKEEQENNSATVVCTCDEFYPRTAKMEFLVDGQNWLNGVYVAPVTKSGSTYTGSGYLTMTASDYKTRNKIACKVTHEGKEFVQILKTSECF